MAIDDRVGAEAVEAVMHDFKVWLEEGPMREGHQEKRNDAARARWFANDYLEAKLGHGFPKRPAVARV